MAEVQFEVVPFGDRWAVFKESRRLSTYARQRDALRAAGQAAYRQRTDGDDCRILVRERTGEWREEPCPEWWDEIGAKYGAG